MDRHRRRIARELHDAGGDLSLTEESPYAVIEGLEGQDEVHRIREACRMILEEAERTINEADRSMQHRMQNSQSIIAQLHALLAENKVAIPNHLAKLVKPGPWSDQENVSPAAAAVEPHLLHLAEARLDRQAETLFAALDVNGDGRLTAQEMGFGPKDRDFRELHKNRDGHISRADFGTPSERDTDVRFFFSVFSLRFS